MYLKIGTGSADTTETIIRKHANLESWFLENFDHKNEDIFDKRTSQTFDIRT
jgi:hypothetical protein